MHLAVLHLAAALPHLVGAVSHLLAGFAGRFLAEDPTVTATKAALVPAYQLARVVGIAGIAIGFAGARWSDRNGGDHSEGWHKVPLGAMAVVGSITIAGIMAGMPPLG